VCDYDMSGDVIMKDVKSKRREGPRLEKIMLDEEFIPELRQKNDELT